MKASFNGCVLAESVDIIYVDGNPYFPREAMHVQYFRDSRHTTVCGWKGKARYWDLIVDDQILTNVAWSYETPKPNAEAIRYRFSFYSGKGVVVAWWNWISDQWSLNNSCDLRAIGFFLFITLNRHLWLFRIDSDDPLIVYCAMFGLIVGIWLINHLTPWDRLCNSQKRVKLCIVSFVMIFKRIRSPSCDLITMTMPMTN